MPIDCLATFTVPRQLVPEKLRRLLAPLGLDPQEGVEISALSGNKARTFDRVKGAPK